MRTPKILFFALLAFLFWQPSQAQFRLFGGPQMTTADYSIRNGHQSTDFKQGFMAGIGLITSVEGPLYFAPSLYFSRKGYKVTYDRSAYPPNADARSNNTTINTICFTPLLQLNFSKSKSHLFLRLGPGLDFALSGTETYDSVGRKQITQDMVFSSTAYSFATAFAAVHLGFEHKSGFSIFAQYEHGLSSLNNADLGPIILHRVVGVSVGWKFGKKR